MRGDESSHNEQTSTTGPSTSARTVLVPLDGSRDAEAAIPIAREAARNLGATIRLLHVSDKPLEREALLKAVTLQPESIVGSVLEGASGSPSEAILHEARVHNAALIVMCTTGWTGGDHGRIGRVAREVLRDATCPLILVTPEVEKSFDDVTRRLGRLLLPLDGTPRTLTALGPAAEIACMCNADLDVLHVVGPDLRANDLPGTLSIPRYQDQPHLIAQQWTREFLRRFCSGFPKQPRHVLVEVGDPGEAIVRIARELRSDLIVIGWSGKLDHDRARTAMAVLREAPCPVLFLRTSAQPAIEAAPAAPAPTS